MDKALLATVMAAGDNMRCWYDLPALTYLPPHTISHRTCTTASWTSRRSAASSGTATSGSAST